MEEKKKKKDEAAEPRAEGRRDIYLDSRRRRRRHRIEEKEYGVLDSVLYSRDLFSLFTCLPLSLRPP